MFQLFFKNHVLKENWIRPIGFKFLKKKGFPGILSMFTQIEILPIFY